MRRSRSEGVEWRCRDDPVGRIMGFEAAEGNSWGVALAWIGSDAMAIHSTGTDVEGSGETLVNAMGGFVTE